jgi:formylglycine-generating enzyme required for sulfatase activity
MTLVYVPAGEFRMGSDGTNDDERPAHTVYLDAFWIDQTEVTNARYRACAAAGACLPPAEKGSPTRGDYYQNGAYAGFPVMGVTWEQAYAYCAWAGRRLPSEAEWEKAARGTDGRRYPWGDGPPDDSLANFDDQAGDTTLAGSYPAGASPYGALDMAGNVWEWVSDWYGTDYYQYSPPENPAGPDTGEFRVIRGGSYNADNYSLRSVFRFGDHPGYWYSDVGLRCAMDESGSE